MTRFFAIALGSNIGDRLFYLHRALGMIDRVPALRVLGASRIYESKGWGREDLEPFLNAVLIAASDTLDARAVLKELQGIENALGRQRAVHWGARTLDLDLLAVDDEVSDDPALTLPHPYIADRPFVYLPLREVAQFHAAFARLAVASEKGKAIEGDLKGTTLGAPVWGFSRSDAGAGSLTWESPSEDRTHQLAMSLAPFILPSDVIALNAPLGSGKSVFARGIAHGLGVKGHVASPTYLLCKSYETPTAPLEHWDFYRLESQDDLESAGFFSPPPGAVRVIEWAEKFPQEITNPSFTVTISIPDTKDQPDLRRFHFSAGSRALPFALRALVAES